MSSSPPPAAGSGPESPTRRGTSSQQAPALGLNFAGAGQAVNGRGAFVRGGGGGGGGGSSSQPVDNGGGGGGGGGLGEDAEEGIDILK